MSETGKLLGNAPLQGGWRLLRFEAGDRPAPRPGDWLRVEGTPLPVMRAADDWLALLAPPEATALAELRPHQHYSLQAIVAEPWNLAEPARPCVLLAQGAGIGSALFLLEQLAAPLKLAAFGGGSWPFKPMPSQFMLAGLPPWAIAAAAPLEERGIPSRLASEDGLPGCFEGSVIELFGDWWTAQTGGEPLTVFAALPAAERQALEALADRRLELRFAPLPGA